MPLRMPCPHCQRPLTVGRRRAGAQLPCPACKGIVNIPSLLPRETVVRFQEINKKMNPATPNLPVPAPMPVASRNGAVIDWRIVGAVGVLSLLLVTGLVASIGRQSLSRNRSEPVAAAVEPAYLSPSLTETRSDRMPAAKIIEPETEEPTAPAEPKVAEEPLAPAEPKVEGQVAAKEPPPAPVVEAKEPVQPDAIVVRRIRNLCDEDLRKRLLSVPELKLVNPAVSDPFVVVQKKAEKPEALPGQQEVKSHLIPIALIQRPDLTGLPTRMGHDCQLGKEPAENLQALSRKLRVIIASAIPNNGTIDPRPDADILRKKLLLGEGDVVDKWLQPEAIPALTQILQAENKPIRLLLNDLLAEIKGPEGSKALAQRALFDLSADVRAAAIQRLADRPRDDFRTVLLQGFDYPWAPVAEHAAEALAALRDREAVVAMKELLTQFEPAAQAIRVAEQLKQMGTVREVVRINHLNNCQLCHARSTSQNDLVRGLVPSPGQPLPPPTTPYYGGNEGIFVRADVTYLKQDFSVPQPVEKPGAWPTMQRYDYLVRTRPVGSADLLRKPDEQVRQALLFALNELRE